MRIAYVVTRADAVGGASIHVLEMGRAMRDQGHDVLVLVGGAGPVTELLAAAGVPFRSLQTLRRAIHPLRDLRAFGELTAALRAFQPDLVSTHTAKAGWLGRAAAARLEIPAIYTPHGLPVGARMPGAAGRFFLLAERAAARWARAIVCVSGQERQLALQHRIGRPEQLVVIHNGVRDVPASLRAAPGKPGPVKIVSVARFEPPKDHALLLRALARLRSQDWQLDLVGGGPLESASRVLAHELGIAERVRFLGYRKDVDAVLAQAQVFALCSRSEALPRSVLEALRAGLPVLATDVGGIREAVDNGESGFLVPAGDELTLADAMAGILADGALRQRLGAQARLTYESRFRVESMIGKTKSLYEMVLSHDASQV
jgi:glycosyltransferase involved in cell wall biosynthesis